jgi:hypothetical protein
VVTDLDQRRAARPDDPVNLCCRPDEASDRLRRLTDAGFDDVVLIDSNGRPGHLEALAELCR